MNFYLFNICRKTSEDSRRVKLRACQHRVHYMPFLAYSQSHVTDKLAGSIVSSCGSTPAGSSGCPFLDLKER